MAETEDDDLDRSDETIDSEPSPATRYLAPSHPDSDQYKLLHDPRAEKYRADFEDLFWKVNAPSSLVTFRSFCANLLQIINDLHEAQRSWEEVEDLPDLTRWIPCLEWICNDPEKTGLFTDPSPYRKILHKKTGVEEYKLIFLGQGMARHQIYGTALFRNNGDKDTQRKYRLLVGHLILANVRFIVNPPLDPETESNEAAKTRLSQAAYQAYDQSKPFLGAPSKAATAIRFMVDASDWLHNLDLSLSPLELVRELKDVGIESSRTHDIELFLKLAYRLRPQGARTSQGNEGGSSWLHGKNWILDGYEFFGDVGDRVVGMRASQRKRQPYDPEKSLESKLSDESGEEDDDGAGETLETVEVGFDPNSDLWEAALSHSQHIDRINQRFRWEYDALEFEDVRTVISQLTNNALLKANSPEADKKDWMVVELTAMLNVMFWMGRPVEEVRELAVSESGNYPLSLRLTPDGAIWRMRAPLPDRVRAFSVPRGAERRRSEFLEVSDHGNAVALIRILHERVRPGGEKRSFHPFRHKPRWYQIGINLLLKSTPRLTSTRISNFFLSRLLESSGGDVVASAIVSGRKLPYARVKMYYACRLAKALAELYRTVSDHMRAELGLQKVKDHSEQPSAASCTVDGQAEQNAKLLEDTNEESDSELYITNQVCPTFDEVQRRIKDLQRQIYKLSRKDDAESKRCHHNVYTLYTVWMFSFATGIRGIATPYLGRDAIGDDGIATLTDKDNRTGYKRRLIWIPEDVLTQMEKYRDFLSRQDRDAGDMPCYFLFPGESQPRVVQVRPSSQRAVLDEPFLQELKKDESPFFNFPINTHRRFMLSELIKAGCPPQVCDAWMGHWYRAEEPWGPFSSYSDKNSRAILQDCLPKLLRKLGFIPLSPKPHRKMIPQDDGQ